MSKNKAKKSRKLANFDPDTPRCGTCKSKSMRGDISLHGPVPWCDWRGKDGSVLEKPAK